MLSAATDSDPSLTDSATVVEQFQTDPDRGLAAEEAARRLVAVGPNEITTVPPIPRWRKFVEQFRGAIALSALLQAVAVQLPFLREAFTTAPLSLTQWLACVAMASTVLWASEIRKLILCFLDSRKNSTQPDRSPDRSRPSLNTRQAPATRPARRAVRQ